MLFASYYFYMAWKPEYIVLIIASTLIDYFAAIMMEKQDDPKKRKLFLILSLCSNLGLLFVFKYFNFFNQEFASFYALLSTKAYPIAGLNLLLPIGISFYTFQTLSYTIDVYKNKRKAERHLGYFALYVTYFPQLVAGPIERSDRLLPQLKKKHKFDYDTAMSATLRICWGFFKKVIIADRVAVIANAVYGDLPSYGGAYLIIATLSFTIQIYCDFSAYSDIAIGCAKLMGVDLMENFKMPYFSKSIAEFWSRWHISLSTWFKDYLYIPLGGSRVNKKYKMYLNILIVFIVSGLWHGANWTFLVWGFLHGFYQLVERTIKGLFEKSKHAFKMPDIIKWAITFVLVLVGWVFFRANTIGDAFYVLSNIGVGGFDLQPLLDMGLSKKELLVLVCCIIYLFITDGIKYQKNTVQLVKSDFAQGLVAVMLILFIIVFGYYGDYDAYSATLEHRDRKYLNRRTAYLNTMP